MAVKTGITNTYTTGIKIASVLTIKGTHASGNVSLTVGPSSSAATGTQSLDYYCELFSYNIFSKISVKIFKIFIKVRVFIYHTHCTDCFLAI